MILFPHMLVGAALGAKIESFWAVFALGVICHFLADMIPHWDYIEDFKEEIKTNLGWFIVKGCLDLFGGAALILAYAWHSPVLPYIIAGMLASILPDVAIVCYLFLKDKFNLNLSFMDAVVKFHNRRAYIGSKAKQAKEMIWETGFAAVFIALIIIFI